MTTDMFTVSDDEECLPACTCRDCMHDVRLDQLREEVRATNQRLDTIEQRLTAFLDSLKPYLEQVGPLIDQITASPMFKMFAPKIKGK